MNNELVLWTINKAHLLLPSLLSESETLTTVK